MVHISQGSLILMCIVFLAFGFLAGHIVGRNDNKKDKK